MLLDGEHHQLVIKRLELPRERPGRLLVARVAFGVHEPRVQLELTAIGDRPGLIELDCGRKATLKLKLLSDRREERNRSVGYPEKLEWHSRLGGK